MSNKINNHIFLKKIHVISSEKKINFYEINALIFAFILLFLNSLIQAQTFYIKDQDNCSHLIGECEYYQCLEAQEQCGSKGYYLDFGYKYCKKYQKKETKLSKNGFLFSQSLRRCLQEKLHYEIQNNSILPSCQNIKDFAIKTHEECYQEFNFCDLSRKDKFKIEWVAKAEIFDKDMVKFGLKLEKSCGPNSTPAYDYENN